MFGKSSQVISLVVLMAGKANSATFPLFEGSSQGLFDDQSSLLWGSPLGLGVSKESSLNYQGLGFSTDNNEFFKIGDLIYNNTRIKKGTGISNAELGINLKFNAPNIGMFDFKYDILINNTTNNGSSRQNSDTVILTPGTGLNALLTTIDNVDYYFEVLGFFNNGAYSNSFVQKEGKSDKAELFGRIVAAQSVPEPSTMALLLLVLPFVLKKPLVKVVQK